jgi:hypothetical protein
VARDWRVKLAFPCLGFGLALSAWATPSPAQQESLAESLFREAREDMKRAKPEQACPKLEESYRLDPSIGTLLNLGLCEQQLGHVATAWTKLRQFADAAPAGDPRLALAREKIGELEKSLPKIRILTTPDAGPATIALDGIELRNASLGVALPVDPGDHLVLITVPTGESKQTRVHVSIGETVDVSLSAPEPRPLVEPTLPPVVAPPSAPAPPALVALPKPNIPALAPRRKTERTLAYVAGAAGTAGLLTSGIFGALALQEKGVVAQHCSAHICRDQIGIDAARAGSRNETIADVAFVAGALTWAAGAVLWWHSGRSGVALSAGAGSASLSYLGTLP